MHRHSRLIITTGVSAVLLLAGAASVWAHSDANAPSATTDVGPYTITLKVLPAETFSGSHAAMSWDGGAQPVEVGGDAGPNHHMVIFVERDGTPVENAQIDMRYRKADSDQKSSWRNLPVARMHARGEGRQTTHFGNNLTLPAGRYEVRVDIEGQSTTMDVTVPS